MKGGGKGGKKEKEKTTLCVRACMELMSDVKSDVKGFYKTQVFHSTVKQCTMVGTRPYVNIYDSRESLNRLNLITSHTRPTPHTQPHRTHVPKGTVSGVRLGRRIGISGGRR